MMTEIAVNAQSVVTVTHAIEKVTIAGREGNENPINVTQEALVLKVKEGLDATPEVALTVSVALAIAAQAAIRATVNLIPEDEKIVALNPLQNLCSKGGSSH